MDRFVVREPRAGADYPQGNQMMTFPGNIGKNMMPTEGLYYGSSPYVADFQNNQRVNRTVFNVPHNMNTSHMGQTRSFGQTNLIPQSHLVNSSGIDARYLAGYPDNAQYVMAGQQIQRNEPSFGGEYQNRCFIGADRNKKQFAPQVMLLEAPRVEAMPKPPVDIKQENIHRQEQNKAPPKKGNEIETIRNEVQTLTRADKLKALHKTGPRTFSGPVEKVLKWHKSLQDIGVLILYEIVAKCVSVRPGDSCAKNLVIRDENGPAMQVVYYEIDFMLPELKPPCTVRVIGRMISGTNRLHAFNVRPATGDDVAMLPRRAAVAAHHVTKLCNEVKI